MVLRNPFVKGEGTPISANPHWPHTLPRRTYAMHTITITTIIITTTIIIITTIIIAIMLRIGLGLLKNLHDLVRAFVLPRIFPVDLVRTYGK